MVKAEERDPIVDIIGNIGKWQWLIILPLAIREIFSSWQMLAPPFLAMEKDFWCVDNGTDNFDNLTDWQRFASPILENGKYDKCNIYDVDYTTLEDYEGGGRNASEYFDTNMTRPCSSWKYDVQDDTDTLISEFNLVCGRRWLITASQVIYMFGVMCGVFVSGLIADNFGRRLVIIGTMMLMTLATFATAFAPSMEVFIFLRWINAGSASAVWTTGYVYCMEIIGGDWKTWMGIGMMFPWAIGYSCLPGLAYMVQDWRYLQLAISAPLPIFVIFYWFLPESPRWLLTKGRVNDAYAILEKAVKINGQSWPQDIQLSAISEKLTNSPDKADEEEESSKNPDDLDKKATFLDLFRTPNMCKNTLIQWFSWFTTSFVYYGITLNADTLIPGNVYINFMVSGLIEIPAYIACLVIIHFFGRRLPLALMYLSSFVILLITIAMVRGPAMVVVVSMGKFGIICVFAIIYLHAAEIFPTVVRTMGLGSASICARVGSMLAPIVGRELGRIDPAATIGIFSLLSLVAGVMTLWLPETKGKKLADTIAEGEALGRVENLFGVKCGKKTRQVPEESPEAPEAQPALSDLNNDSSNHPAV